MFAWCMWYTVGVGGGGVVVYMKVGMSDSSFTSCFYIVSHGAYNNF